MKFIIEIKLYAHPTPNKLSTFYFTGPKDFDGWFINRSLEQSEATEFDTVQEAERVVSAIKRRLGLTLLRAIEKSEVPHE